MAVPAEDVGFWSWIWQLHLEEPNVFAPILTFASGLLTVIVGSVVAYAALKQARTATRQAGIARERHEEQTRADLQRRITESFTKAIEQLGSDKLQMRLGGIYTLERISRESKLDYWPIMEILTGFVRERAPWKAEDTALSQAVKRVDQFQAPQEASQKLPTDVAAVLTVLSRRDARNRERERSEKWRLELNSTDLRGATLTEAHFEGADLTGAHLEGADLTRAHLEGTFLGGAHLEGAFLAEAHLAGADLAWAHLERADLTGAHLEGAFLNEAHLEGANLARSHLVRAFLAQAHLKGAHLSGAHLEAAILNGANLEGAYLGGATGLNQEQLETTIGDAETHLPNGITRPAHWA